MSLLAQVEAAYANGGKPGSIQLSTDEESTSLAQLWSPTLSITPTGTSVKDQDLEDAKTIVTITSAESAYPNRSTSTGNTTMDVTTPSLDAISASPKLFTGQTIEVTTPDAELPDYARDLLSSFSDTSAGPDTLSLHDYAPSSASRPSFSPSSVAPTSPRSASFGAELTSPGGSETPRGSVAFPDRTSIAEPSANAALEAPPTKRRMSLASDMTLLSRPSLSPSALPPDLNVPRQRLRTQSLNPLRNSLHWPGSEQKRASTHVPIATSPLSSEFGEMGPGERSTTVPPRTRKRSALALAIGTAIGVGMAVGNAAASAEMPRSPDGALRSPPVTPSARRRKERAVQGGAEVKADVGTEKATFFGKLGLATVKGKA